MKKLPVRYDILHCLRKKKGSIRTRQFYGVRRWKRVAAVITLSLMFSMLLSSCATAPSNPDNLCSVFAQKRGWKKHAERAQDKWGSSVPVMMAIMHQESRYVDNARPPRKRFLGIPLWRISSSYGYAQAKDSTWKWYKDSTGRRWADRDDFDDAIDFIGWYNRQTNKQNGIALTDTYSLYLAYHEGHGGFRSGSYKQKEWLLNVAAKVRDRANLFSRQLRSCK